MSHRKAFNLWIGLVAFLCFQWSCTQPPTLVMKPQPSLIPDGIAINVFTSELALTFRTSAGQLVQVPFLAVKESPSVKPSLPSAVRPKRQVEGWVTIPPSGTIAVLTSTERWGLWPPDLLAMLAGHPIPNNTFYLELFTASGQPITEAKCIKGTYLSGRIHLAP
jgi:hypothetical protein